MGTPTGHVEFRDGLVLGSESIVMFADGLRGDAGQSRDDVFRAAAEGFDAVDQFDGFFVAEDFTACRLGDVVFVPPMVVNVVVNDFLEAEYVNKYVDMKSGGRKAYMRPFLPISPSLSYSFSPLL